MMYEAKVAACSENGIKNSSQREHRLEFGLLNLVVRKETDRL